MAHVHLSWLNPHKERRLMIVGSRKMAELDDIAAEKLRIYDRGYDRPPEFANFAEYLTLRNGDIYVPQVAMAEPLAVEARHFVDCIAGARRRAPNLASGLRVVRLLDAAQTSLERGGEPISLVTIESRWIVRRSTRSRVKRSRTRSAPPHRGPGGAPATRRSR